MKQILTEQQIDNILNENLNQDAWLFQLGVNSTEDFKNSDNDFSFPFYEKGKEMWEKYKPILKEIICDKENQQIKGSYEEFLLGNGREIIFVLIDQLCNKHNLSLSIAIPLVSLVLKIKIQNFCRQ